MIGSKESPFNYNRLVFTSHPGDSLQASSFHRTLQRSLQNRYGSGHTSVAPSNATKIEWKGYENIQLELDFIPEENLIIFAVSEYALKPFNSPVNWFRDSEYDEHFNEAFKTFDSRNGYKELKFGMSLTAVRNLVSLKAGHAAREYSISNDNYLRWDYNIFDDCSITLNKAGKLYDVVLLKAVEEEQEYDHLLDGLTELLGQATSFKEKSGDSEVTLLKGKELMIIILRPTNDLDPYKLDKLAVRIETCC